MIPWFEGPDVTLLNVRRPIDTPKYWAVKGSRRGGIYPSSSAIRTGIPLVIAEGELDTLLLAQELAGLASVVTLGTAGDRPSPATLGAMLGASPWFVSGDADDAGEKSSQGWLATSKRCRRLRPPSGKDWTEAHQAGVGLRGWWTEALQRMEILPRPDAIDGPESPARPADDPAWNPPSWWVLALWDHFQGCLEAFEERTSIMEFDGGLEQAEAERRAFVEVFGG